MCAEGIHETVQGAPTPVRLFVSDAGALTPVNDTGVVALEQRIDGVRGGDHLRDRSDEGGDAHFVRLRGLTEKVGDATCYPTVLAAVDVFTESTVGAS
jgi:hypothetical protein